MKIRKTLTGYKVSFPCPHCNEGLTEKLERAGQQQACPACARPIVVPGEAQLQRWNQQQAEDQERLRLEREQKQLEREQRQQEREAASQQAAAERDEQLQLKREEKLAILEAERQVQEEAVQRLAKRREIAFAAAKLEQDLAESLARRTEDAGNVYASLLVRYFGFSLVLGFVGCLTFVVGMDGTPVVSSLAIAVAMACIAFSIAYAIRFLFWMFLWPLWCVNFAADRIIVEVRNSTASEGDSGWESQIPVQVTP